MRSFRPVRWLRRGFGALLRVLALASGAYAALIAPTGAAPATVVTVKPLHSLVAGVMQGVGEPLLLIRGAATPHAYSLRPSDARALQHADLVFWVGEGLETTLRKPLRTLAITAKLIAASELPGLIKYPLRDGGAWPVHEDHSHDAETAAEAASESWDSHIWLDPRNAQRIVAAVAAELIALDPTNAQRYRKNAAALESDLRALDREIEKRLAPLRHRPFLVFHDAFQYFERRYGLQAAGALLTDPDRPPGARRLGELRARMQATGAVCVFAEPQFNPALLKTLVADSQAGVATLDPLGATLPAGPSAYAALMRHLATALHDCLAPKG